MQDRMTLKTPYAVASFRSKESIRVLFLSYTMGSNVIPAIRYFIDTDGKQVGSVSTIWKRYRSEPEAIDAINSAIARINSHFSITEVGVVTQIFREN